MRLTAYTNYALRILMYCALHGGQLVRVQDVADAHGISRAHLLKAARELGQLGYLENVRGRAGGIRLAKGAETITVGEIVRHTEDLSEFVECFNDSTNTCPLAGACGLTGVFSRGLKAFFAELDTVRLSDLVRHPGPLLERLSAPGPSVPAGA
ncbi:Rrf2 family transcriptional regulator [Henriciella aquimarina]|uniref:Rrf2 family transcriptional regulator n=1 Tax=Henriciella aquimarina TaxID=545261 RepID=UPI0009FCD694|nr:Rrf2 family transcriptional regulator [Henriciella aquimarina]